jgi:hypothetical protein
MIKSKNDIMDTESENEIIKGMRESGSRKEMTNSGLMILYQITGFFDVTRVVSFLFLSN